MFTKKVRNRLFILCLVSLTLATGFLGGTLVKNPPANAGDAGDTGSIPGSGSSPGGGNATHSSIRAWKIPWLEEPGKLQSTGSQRVRHN